MTRYKRRKNGLCAWNGCYEPRLPSRSHCKKHRIQNRQRQWKDIIGAESIDIAALLKQQEFKCAICRTDLVVNQLDISCLDHDHKTGLPRKLLCSRCNKVLGMVDENIKLLGSFIKYLELMGDQGYANELAKQDPPPHRNFV